MILIDGHNLLWAIRQNDSESEIDSEIRLCRTLDRHFGLIGRVAQIVFDGAGPRDMGEFGEIRNLEVFFSGFGTDTDTLIEERIQAHTAPRRLTVVSSDRRLRKAANARGATVKRSELFWVEVRKQLDRKPRRRIKEPPAKRRGLTESETQQWMDVFGLD